MAGIGMYGVYYSKGVLTDGVLTGYSGVQTMGKAISATFEPADVDDNPLYANNAIAETDATASAGGTLTITLDKLVAAARSDIFGLTQKSTTVTVGESTETGTGFDYDGSEQANPVGIAFIRSAQENQSRDIHEAVIFSYCTFNPPTDEYATMEESVEWQTPELEAVVSGGGVIGTFPWKRTRTFETQAAAIQFITDTFASA